MSKFIKTIFHLLTFSSMTVAASSVVAATITYNFDFTTGTTRIAGNLTTNWTLGVLADTDFQGTNFSIFDANQEYKFIGTTKPNCTLYCSPVYTYGNPLTATATEIQFNISATNYDFAVIGGKGANDTGGEWKLTNNGVFPAFGRISVIQSGAPQLLSTSYTLPRGYTFGTAQATQVPIPSSLLLMAIGLCAFARKSSRTITQRALR
jgi:hypothetical protein